MAVQFDAGDDHGSLGGVDAPDRLLHRFRERLGVALSRDGRVGADLIGHHGDHVAGQFEVNRRLQAVRRVEQEVDVAEGGCRIDDLQAGGAELVEDLELRPPFANTMVQERVVGPFTEARGSGDHHHRALLGRGTRDRVGQRQPPHAVGHAHRPHAVDAGVGIGGEAGAVLTGAVHEVERALLQHAVEGEHVITGEPEDVANPVVGKPSDQVLPDREARHALGTLDRGPLCRGRD